FSRDWSSDVCSSDLYGASLVFQYTPIARPTMEVSDYINAHKIPGDAVWQDDAARLLLETNLRCGSRYPLMFLLVNSDSAPLEYRSEERRVGKECRFR